MMNLDGPTLDWFQDIPKNAYTNLEEMEKYFIEAFSLHNIDIQIYNFKQAKHVTIRDCLKRSKKYILRCPKVEIPNQEQLVSILLQGFLSKKLHASLYPMKHKTLAASIKDTIELDDNVDEYKDERPMGIGDVGSQQNFESRMIVRATQPLVTTSQVPAIQEVANEIIQQMNLNQRTPI